MRTRRHRTGRADRGRALKDRRRRAGDGASAAKASSTVSAKTEMQSSVRQAGTRPALEKAQARLQADDVVEPGRHAAGAGGVGAERERNETGGHRDAEPELEPPGMSSSNALRGTP